MTLRVLEHAVLAALVASAAACKFDMGGPAAASSDDAAGPGTPDARNVTPIADAGPDPRPDAEPEPDATPPQEDGTVVSRRVDRAIVLDGLFEDWDGAEFYTFAIQDADDLHLFRPEYEASATLTFASLHDATYIYFALIMVDDEVVSHGQGLVYEDDGVSLYLDGSNDRDGFFGFDDHEIVIDVEGTWSDYADGATIDLDGDVTTSVTGYVMELSMRKDSFGVVELTDRLGFDLAINEDDGLGNEDADAYGLWFQRDGDRCEECCAAFDHAEAWCDTTMFGTLVLAE